jgi:hypothetical protein
MKKPKPKPDWPNLFIDNLLILENPLMVYPSLLTQSWTYLL